MYHVWGFVNVRPSNQPAITAVALCRKSLDIHYSDCRLLSYDNLPSSMWLSAFGRNLLPAVSECVYTLKMDAAAFYEMFVTTQPDYISQ
jgi:hypothetical protein